MKKLLSILVVLMLMLAVATGCGKKADPDSLTKIGDLEKMESMGYAYDDEMYVTVFINQGDYYRAEAKMPTDVLEALNALSWEDDDHTKKVLELVAPLNITKLTNISEGILSEEEMNKLAGKTGQDLLNDGWETMAYFPDEHTLRMDYNYFQYDVTFNSTFVESDEMDYEALVKPLTVESVSFVGVSSSAVNIEY